VKTQHGILLRPVHRLYPLEVPAADSDIIADRMKVGTADEAVSELPVPRQSDTDATVITRSGRIVTRPKRLAE